MNRAVVLGHDVPGWLRPPGCACIFWLNRSAGGALWTAQTSRARRPIEAGRDANGRQRDRHAERLGGPGQEADIELRQVGARFRANGCKYLLLIVDQHQGTVLIGPDTEISVHRSSHGGSGSRTPEGSRGPERV